MDLSLKLALFRKYRQWQPEDVARKLGLSLQSYVDIETGKVKTNNIVAKRLSDLYQAPRELFITNDFPSQMRAEVMYSNCTFINGPGSSSGYINHQYNDRGIDEIIFSKKEEIKKLQDQIEHLQQQNTKLTELIGKRVVTETT
jgi:DNA-binding XRE family transcriptional regulator